MINRKKLMDRQDFYYDSFFGRILGSKAREKLILKQIEKIEKNQKFLEIGCAQGYYLKEALKKTDEVTGIEINKEFVAEAKKNVPKAKTYVGNAEKTTLKEKYDFILCTEVLEHLENRKNGIEELKRLCSKDGLVVITVPLEQGLIWKTISLIFEPKKYRGHLNLPKAEDIEKEMKGFKLIEKEYIPTPSITLNKLLKNICGERTSLYCFFVFKNQQKNTKN